MRALLDVNALLAVIDEAHVHHHRSREWFGAHAAEGWASCAITQNGFVRTLSQPRYSNAASTADALRMLGEATSARHHQYWSCSVSLTDDGAIDGSRVLGPKQVTDIYLLALAVVNGGRLVTFDQSIPLAAVRNATPDHLVIL